MSELALLPCPKCGGSGSFEEPNPFFIHDDDDSTEDEFHSVACPACSGAGKLSAGACPHCGSHDVFVERADTSSAYVMCNDCACRGPIGSTEGDDMEEVPGGIEAITAWNKRTPTEWQDIESAPRDGSEVLLVCATAYTPTAFEGWWADGNWQHYSRDGDHGEKFSHNGIHAFFPTHWMPKPSFAPPASRNGEGRT